MFMLSVFCYDEYVLHVCALVICALLLVCCVCYVGCGLCVYYSVIWYVVCLVYHYVLYCFVLRVVVCIMCAF